MGEKKDRISGQMKAKAGRATGKFGLEEKGRVERSKGQLKRAGKGIKDAVKKDP